MDLIFRNFGRKNPRINTRRFSRTKKNLCKTNNFGLKHETSKNMKFRLGNTKFWFKTPKFRFEKSEVSVKQLQVSGRKSEVSSKILDPETSVKVVLRNASVAETRNFELLCSGFIKQNLKRNLWFTLYVGHRWELAS
jgi:hypothetical protein